MRAEQRALVKTAGSGVRQRGVLRAWPWLVLALVVPGGARAAELSVQGPAACPDAAELAFRVERAIGVPLASAAALRFAVTFQRGTPGYGAELQVTGGEAAPGAARSFRAEDCSRLGDAVGLAIALALGAAAPAERWGRSAAASKTPEDGAARASLPPQ